MRPEDEQVLVGLLDLPGRGRRTSIDDVLRHFGTEDGVALRRTLMLDAMAREDGRDLELATYLASTFEYDRNDLSMLIELSSADWHQLHEQIAWALDQLRTPETIDALYYLTHWVPEYLQYNDGYALAAKAVRALAKLDDPRADDALRQVISVAQEDIRELAVRKLAERHAG